MKSFTVGVYLILLVGTVAFSGGCYEHPRGVVTTMSTSSHDERWHYDHDCNDQWRHDHPWNAAYVDNLTAKQITFIGTFLQSGKPYAVFP